MAKTCRKTPNSRRNTASALRSWLFRDFGVVARARFSPRRRLAFAARTEARPPARPMRCGNGRGGGGLAVRGDARPVAADRITMVCFFDAQGRFVMLIGLIIVWLFWGVIIFMLAYWRRSWMPVPAIPIALSLIVWLVSLWSEAVACWGSVLFHLYLTISLVIACIKGRKLGDDPLFSRPPKP